jgi:hypothetical protein
MAGALIKCGDFEGGDKSGSPIAAVLAEAFHRSFGRKPNGRVASWFAGLLGRRGDGVEGVSGRAILSVRYDESGRIPPDVCAHLLPTLRSYQQEVLARLGISDDIDAIVPHMRRSTGAKYGWRDDDGWRAYCLHDLVHACELSARDNRDVEVLW